MPAAPASFTQVEVLTKANVYFEGRVVSHTVLTADGTRLTLGILQQGTYHFGTDAPERMQIVSGTARVLLDGQVDAQVYGAGGDFVVPGSSGFEIAAEGGLVEYVCTFL